MLIGLVTFGGLAVAVWFCGYWISHRWIVGPRVDSTTINNSVGQLIRVCGALLAFLVALTFTRVSENREQLKDNMEVETAQLRDIYHDAGRLGEGASQLRDVLSQYVRSLHEDEWPALTENIRSEKTEALFQQMEEATLGLDCSSPAEEMLRDRILQDLDEISDFRQERLYKSESSLPGFFFLVSFGYLIVAMFMGAYALNRTNVILMAMGAAFVGSVLYLIVAMSNPFSGPLPLEPKAFLDLGHQFQS